MRKKFLSIFLVICLCCTSWLINIPCNVLAATNTKVYNDFEYTETNEGTIQIEKYCGNDSEVVVPSEIEGKKVKKINGNAFSWCLSVTKVVVSEGIEYIYGYAFYYCINLKTVELPKSVTAIPAYGFYGCKNLETIKVSDNLTSIGTWGFAGCNNLKSISIPEGMTQIYDGTFVGCNSIERINIPNGITKIGNSAFSSCSSLKEITIPEGVTSIGDEAFSGCEELTSIIIPEGVQTIGKLAFAGCGGITNITIPASVTSIGNDGYNSVGGAFSNCGNLENINVESGNPNYYSSNGILYRTSNNALLACGSAKTSVDIPSETKYICNYAFAGCEKFTEIELPSSLLEIGECAFKGCTGIERIDLPDGLKTIGAYAFEKCININNIDLPESLETIGDSAFHLCSFENIIIPDKVTSIGSEAFRSCENLKSVEIKSNKISAIQSGLFWDCKRLENINIPDSITKLDSYAFKNCEMLSQLQLPNDLEEIGYNTFTNCISLTSISIPSNIQNIGEGVFSGCKKLKEINMQQNNYYYCVQNNILYDSIRNIVIACGVEEKKVDILDGFTKIGDGAFAYCTLLEEVEIPESVVWINTYAFNGCSSLKSIVLPSGVATIGDCAFEGCSNLEEMILPLKIKTLGNMTFKGCKKLKKIEIPSSVTLIGNQVFMDCENLSKIIIPESVTSMYRSIFDNCNPNLIAYVYPDSYAEEYLKNNMINYRYIGDEDTCLHLLGKVTDNAILATCTESGKTEGCHCTECGQILVEQQVVPALGHDWDDGVITKQATATENGIRTYTCRNDPSHTRNEVIPATGNSNSEETPDPSSGMESDSETSDNTNNNTNEDTNNDTNNNANNGVIDNNTPYLHQHVIVVDGAVAPTCVENGKTEGSHCSVCGETIVAQQIIPATGHINTSVKNQKASTYFEKGYTGDAVCNDCGAVISRGKSVSKKVLSKVTLSSVKSTKSKQLNINWKKNKNVSGYQIQYSTDKSFKKSVKTVKVSSAKTCSKTISKLKGKTKYYVRVRAYKTGKVKGKSKTVYSVWSIVKNIVVKK